MGRILPNHSACRREEKEKDPCTERLGSTVFPCQDTTEKMEELLEHPTIISKRHRNAAPISRLFRNVEVRDGA